MVFFEEFDPGSGWTLAERLTHASRTLCSNTKSGKRASNAYLICPKVENNYRDVANSQYAHDGEIPMWGKIYRFWRRVRPIMVVGEVIAYQAFDG